MAIKLNTILLITIVVLLFAILISLIIIAARTGNKNYEIHHLDKNQINSNDPKRLINSKSDFFTRSMAHAEDVVAGAIPITGSFTGGGESIIHSFMILNDTEKKKIMQTMNFFQSDPLIYSDIEDEFRRISVQDRLPIWLVILSEAMKRNNLNFSQHSPLRMVTS